MWIRERDDLQPFIEGLFLHHRRPRVVDDVVSDKPSEGFKVVSATNLRVLCRYCARKIGEITESGVVTPLPEADSVCRDPFSIDF